MPDPPRPNPLAVSICITEPEALPLENPLESDTLPPVLCVLLPAVARRRPPTSLPSPLRKVTSLPFPAIEMPVSINIDPDCFERASPVPRLIPPDVAEFVEETFTPPELRDKPFPDIIFKPPPFKTLLAPP